MNGLTPWFPPSTRPAREGQYKVRLVGGAGTVFMLWEHGAWRWPHSKNPSPAANTHGVEWRGLSAEHLGDEVWTCKDGRRMAVGDMSEEHVRSALRMILAESRRRKEARLAKPRAGRAQLSLVN